MSETLICQTEDGRAKIQLQFTDNAVWLTQADMAGLFRTTKQNISLYIKNILEEGEIVETLVVKEFKKGGGYFEELLERIRVIRSSVKYFLKS
jgi:hypothetical protein